MLHTPPHGYGEGDLNAITDGTNPAAGDALGVTKQASGQHQGRGLMYRQPVSLHELHPTDDRTVGRVDLIDLHSLPVATGDMTQRAGRRIRSKTARMMLTFRHFEFKHHLKWKAWQRGTLVLDVNEAYTSKTCSWDGLVNSQLGGAKVIRDETGFGMDRDVNGARGIFLRALGESLFLRGLLTQVALQQITASSIVC